MSDEIVGLSPSLMNGRGGELGRHEEIHVSIADHPTTHWIAADQTHKISYTDGAGHTKTGFISEKDAEHLQFHIQEGYHLSTHIDGTSWGRDNPFFKGNPGLQGRVDLNP